MDAIFDKIYNIDQQRTNDERYIEGNTFNVLFLRRNPLVTDELFPVLEKKLRQTHFQERFVRLYKKQANMKREHLLAEVRKCRVAGSDPSFYEIQIPLVDQEIAISHLADYFASLRLSGSGHASIIEILEDSYRYLNESEEGMAYVGRNYHLYRVAAFLYEDFQARKLQFERFEQPCAMALSNIYSEKGINLQAADQQFAKYKLLSLGDTFRIANSKESRTVIDERIGRHFWIDMSQDLLAAIEVTIANSWVRNIAFNIELITDSIPSFEAREYGSLFSFSALDLPAFSKFYDDVCYDNSLWITVDRKLSSMTFEELCEDFPELDGKVITQIVHLEFFMEEDRYFISHIDHEYILYTLDDYAARLSDAGIRGVKKLKTFKIDKARIPFEFCHMQRLFLFQILDVYFRNKSVIREYFSRVLQR